MKLLICADNRKINFDSLLSGNSAKNVNFDWKGNFIKDDFSNKQLDAKKGIYKIRDLWTKKDLSDTNSTLKTTVPAHDVVMLRLTKQFKSRF
ncbi:MAG: hypothetical protein ACR2GD_07205 [Pyrinomonadaceae bacterium]